MSRTERPCDAYTWPFTMPSTVSITRDADSVFCAMCEWPRRSHVLEAMGTTLPPNPRDWVGFNVWLTLPGGLTQQGVVTAVHTDRLSAPITLVLLATEGLDQTEVTIPWTSVLSVVRVRAGT